jgi:type III secretory pathway component EscS
MTTFQIILIIEVGVIALAALVGLLKSVKTV